MGSAVCDVILAYKCASMYSDTIKTIQQDLPNISQK